MRNKIGVLFALPTFIFMTTLTANAQTRERQVELYPQQFDTYSVQQTQTTTPQRTDSSTQRFVNPNETQGIECCTTWDTVHGTTGCASFAGDSCPDYAPYEAY